MPTRLADMRPCAEKLAGHAWSGVWQLEAFGVAVTLRCDAALLDSIAASLPQFLSRGQGGPPLLAVTASRLHYQGVDRAVYAVLADRALAGTTLCPREAAALAIETVCRVIAEHAPRHIVLHAGAVGVAGRGVLLPGPSCSGKSTLVAALVARGATYYSDEYAVLDEQGRVLPFPRALRLRTPNGAARRDLEQPTQACPALPVGVIALARYTPRGPLWYRRESPGRAALGLLAHALQARTRPEPTLDAIARSCATARAFELTRAEADDAAQWLISQAHAAAEARLP